MTILGLVMPAVAAVKRVKMMFKGAKTDQWEYRRGTKGSWTQFENLENLAIVGAASTPKKSVIVPSDNRLNAVQLKKNGKKGTSTNMTSGTKYQLRRTRA